MPVPFARCPRVVLAVVLLVLLLPFGAAAEERRVALVIGNGGYLHVGRLANPGNDAALVAQTLRGLGFTLVGGGVQSDLDKPHFDAAVRAFGQAMQGAEVAVFYYAGHGMQVAGTNWLVPVDANPTRVQDLDFQMVDAGLVLKQMDGAGTRLNIVILDACRNNPFAGLSTRATAGGLAEMRAPEGTLISFATQPGNVAADGAGKDGPYALALTEAMRRPNLDIFHLFNQVGLAVKHATGGSQQPWVSSSPIDGDFYFNRGDAADTEAAAESVQTVSVEVAPASATGSTGVEQLRGAADQGRPEAQTELALAYLGGRGVTRDPATAAQLFDKAAAQGFARAQYFSGEMHERGLGGIPRSYEDAVLWYRRAAEQNDPLAQLALGRLYARGLGVPRDLAQSATWYRRAAEQGNPVAQFAFGQACLRGAGVPKNTAAGVQWVRLAAERNYPSAQIQLGLILLYGKLVPQNTQEGLQWLHRAADRNNRVAQSALGRAYRDGIGVPRDYQEAMRWFRLAADQGFAPAAMFVGLMYAEGQGVPRDRTQGVAWLTKAAEAGYLPAASRLRQVEEAK